ncbi:hypothetical protein COO60DRAFT_1509130 [Scenedesmus sp. NREL 46B-D3]|nr:hypothetical protein COO60DRAFT_1509130 [Scenedesmus sp. NREL 46B-D3]
MGVITGSIALLTSPLCELELGCASQRSAAGIVSEAGCTAHQHGRTDKLHLAETLFVHARQALAWHVHPSTCCTILQKCALHGSS